MGLPTTPRANSLDSVIRKNGFLMVAGRSFSPSLSGESRLKKTENARITPGRLCPFPEIAQPDGLNLQTQHNWS